jgi:hypothetical protein
MKPMKTRLIYSWMVIASAAFAVSCTEDDNGGGTAMLEVRMTDAPGNYEEVIVDIQDVQVKASDDDSEEGWISLDVNEGKYDLLKLTNGLDTLLGTAELPAGRISQVRLVLGNENTVKVDGILEGLVTPSAEQSGLKVNVNADLDAGLTYTLLLDFDAARSIVATGSGNYILKPVIRAFAEVNGGSIAGDIEPANSMATVYAIAGTDSTSTFADDAGEFLFRGLDEGVYRVVIVPGEGYLELEVEDVDVNNGEITDLGTLILTEQP